MMRKRRVRRCRALPPYASVRRFTYSVHVDRTQSQSKSRKRQDPESGVFTHFWTHELCEKITV